MRDSLTIGTIGTGKISYAFARACEGVPGVRITHVYSRDQTTADTFAGRIGADHAVSDLTDLLDDRNLGAVYIASPNSFHHDHAMRAITAGKHVLVEKPATCTEADWQELVAAAAQRNVILLEAMRTEYDPGIALIESILPALGTIRRVSLRYEKRSERYSRVLAGARVNIFDPDFGGGALLDLGTYGAHALVRLFGDPPSVHAALVPIAGGTDGAGIILAEYPTFVADVSFSKVTDNSAPSVIQGEVGTLTIDHIASPRHLTLTGRHAPDQEWSLTEPQHSMAPEIQRFHTAVTTRADIRIDHARTTATLRILDTARNATLQPHG